MSNRPRCKVCESEHYSYESHVFAAEPVKKEGLRKSGHGKIPLRVTVTPPVTVTHEPAVTVTDMAAKIYISDHKRIVDEMQAEIESLKAQVKKLKPSRAKSQAAYRARKAAKK